jgi:hypothetical protein
MYTTARALSVATIFVAAQLVPQRISNAQEPTPSSTPVASTVELEFKHKLCASCRPLQTGHNLLRLIPKRREKENHLV